MAFSRRAAKRFAFIALLNLAVVLVLLVVADGYLFRQGFRAYVRTYPGRVYATGSVPWARIDSSLGWTIDPAYLANQINPQGFRDAKDFVTWPRQPDQTRLMMLGDSFVVGAHLNPDRTLPRLVESELGTRSAVFSVAVPGWGIDQMYLAYQRYKDVIHPHLVVLAFIDDGVERVLETYRDAERLAKPVLTVRDGRLTPQDSAPAHRLWINALLGRSIFLSLIAREFYVATDAKAIVRHVFRTIADDLKQRNGRLFIVRIPTRSDRERISRLRRRIGSWGASLNGTGAVYLDPAEHDRGVWSKDLYVEDGHLNAAGTERLAGDVVRLIRE